MFVPAFRLCNFGTYVRSAELEVYGVRARRSPENYSVIERSSACVRRQANVRRRQDPETRLLRIVLPHLTVLT